MQGLLCVVVLLAVGAVLGQEQQVVQVVPQETLHSVENDAVQTQQVAAENVRDKRGLLLAKAGIGLLGLGGLGLGLGAVAAKTALVGGAGLLAAKSLGHGFYGGGYGYGRGYGHGYGGYGHGYGGYHGGVGISLHGYGHGHGYGGYHHGHHYW